VGHLRSVKSQEEAEFEIEQRFMVHSADDLQVKKMENVRDECLATARHIIKYVPQGREQALALTALEEVMFWANAGIARN
jgi:hypothetical protein